MNCGRRISCPTGFCRWEGERERGEDPLHDAKRDIREKKKEGAGSRLRAFLRRALASPEPNRGGYKVLVCGDIDSLPCPGAGCRARLASIRIIASLSFQSVFLTSALSLIALRG